MGNKVIHLRVKEGANQPIPLRIDGYQYSELPDVGTEDNGKLLAVIDGQWAAAELNTCIPALTDSEIDNIFDSVFG